MRAHEESWASGSSVARAGTAWLSPMIANRLQAAAFSAFGALLRRVATSLCCSACGLPLTALSAA